MLGRFSQPEDIFVFQFETIPCHLVELPPPGMLLVVWFHLAFYLGSLNAMIVKTRERRGPLYEYTSISLPPALRQRYGYHRR